MPIIKSKTVMPSKSYGVEICNLRQLSGYASTPMLYDVEIMEQFYGADDDDTGNDTYTFAVSPETIQTNFAGGTI